MKNKRVILITGESSGFGLAMAEAFLRNGDIVCGCARRDFQHQGIFHQMADVTKKDDCQRVIEEIVHRYGRIDILINNAGFGIFGPLEETALEQAKKQIDVILFGGFLMAQAALPYMRESGAGKIFNISSIGGLIPLPYQGFYCAGKAALDTLFSSLRVEVYPYHIQICSIKPGDAKTGFTAQRKLEALKPGSVYQQSVAKNLRTITHDEQNGFAPVILAKKVLRLSKRKKLPFSKLIGLKDSLLYRLVFYLIPRRISNYLIYKIYA